MGNCMVIHGRKEIKVVSFVDGEILKALPAPAPLLPAASSSSSDKVVVVSSSDAGHAAPKTHHAQLDMAQLYRLFHAAPPAADHPAAAGDVVRVKLVISKQELRRMLGKEGQHGVSVDDVVALMRSRQSSPSSTTTTELEMSCCRSSAGWRPALQSIPEGCTDFFH